MINHSRVSAPAALLLTALAAISACSREAPSPPASTPPSAAAQASVARLSPETNGLTIEDRQRYYHLSEGGELYPVDWLLALEVETTGAGGQTVLRPFMENIERFGFIPDDKSAGNPYGLPVGFSVAPSMSGAEMVGLNCTACHVGEIAYRGTRVRIDGGPSLALVNAFIKGVIQETERTLEHPTRGVKFLESIKETRIRRPSSAPAPPTGTLSRIEEARDAVRAHLAALKALAGVGAAADKATPDGYGRVDAFGQGRNELFGSNPANIRVPNASVSFPHTWGMRNTLWLQWGANTNSVIERNIGQALGVGAWVDVKTWDSSVRIDNLAELEQTTYKITPPAWPASFPPIDQPKADRGRTLFTTHCAPCHESWSTTPTGLRQYQLFPLDVVKTDPSAATAFEAPVSTPTGDQPFPLAAFAVVGNVKAAYYKRHGITPQQAAAFEDTARRTPPQLFRLPLAQASKYPDTQGGKVYRSKTLVGIWATAPFLHNGSVPTLYDLLKPAAERPKYFPVGQREYDPLRLGYQQDPAKFTRVPGATDFVYDTSLPGSANTGHEWEFYPTLTDDDRYAIIEFLKTYTKELFPTGVVASR